ncbi:GNAT family N-acetyltransferase [Lactobacillus sp. LC28-10]|uniref:GNAT family N-acetyltransferase n=1 Tax=Secundilactobacillus angelensis TaxID=2722706 RepID=A0ABX1L2Y9_9LACO|nr:GNAT family N-acetyltransferase [Secundilactobacillus angelensis]MCH5462793.1 GNAT family N-acetyltransferase [Secundilactobacillus angelensis]NLR19563.1 GNAT family N-acetyltransferase [Secundilactobacillus angelensis]
MLMIKTERLTIRQFVESDLDDYYAIVGDVDSARAAGFQYAHRKADAAYMLRSAISQGMVFAIVETVTQRVIGSIGLYPRIASSGEQEEDSAEIGYVLNQSYWGQGYMTEAAESLIRTVFDQRLLKTIWASFLEDNLRSKGVLEKLGFYYVDRFTHSPHALYEPGKTEVIYRRDREN